MASLVPSTDEYANRCIVIEQCAEKWPVKKVWDSGNRLRLTAICLASVANGFNDAATGAVVPYVEKYYDNGYVAISLIFVGQALGSVFAVTYLNDLRARLGRADVFLGVANMITIGGYIPIVAAAPYLSIPMAFCAVGFGTAINMAFGVILCGSSGESMMALAHLHGCYGVGGTIGALITTNLFSNDALWSRVYLVHLGLAACVFALNLWSFRNYEQEYGSDVDKTKTPPEKLALNNVLLTMPTRVVFLGAIFMFASRGVEASISDWVVSFLGDIYGPANSSSVGHVLAGFWAGIASGCFVVPGLAQSWGEKPLVFGLTIGVFVFQALLWLVPGFILNQIATAAIGFMLGLVYPCAATVLMRNVARRELLGEILIAFSAFGSLGAAAASLLTGLLIEPIGMFVMHPICLFMYVLMIASWIGMPGEALGKP